MEKHDKNPKIILKNIEMLEKYLETTLHQPIDIDDYLTGKSDASLLHMDIKTFSNLHPKMPFWGIISFVSYVDGTKAELRERLANPGLAETNQEFADRYKSSLKIINDFFQPKIPSKEMGENWICSSCTEPMIGGKWVLSFDQKQIDVKWNELLDLYNEHTLPFVTGMKVSTAKRTSDLEKYVIFCYCEGTEAELMAWGKRLAEILDYKSGNGFMYYKSDEINLKIGVEAEEREDWFESVEFM
jgi:hypothetical protein